MEWQKDKRALAVRGEIVRGRMSELKPQSWDTIAKVAGLGESAELFAAIFAVCLA